MLLSGDILESDLGGQDGASKGRDQQNEIADCCLHSIKDSHCFEADFFVASQNVLGERFPQCSFQACCKPRLRRSSAERTRLQLLVLSTSIAHQPVRRMQFNHWFLA